MRIYDRILGHPFVYNRIRPLVVGGVDNSPVYERLLPNGQDVILDLGCGTGDALNYLSQFGRYVGMDVDEVAVRFARRRYGHDPRVSFENKLCTRADVEAIAPTRVVMAGLLHHLNESAAVDILRMVTRSPRLRLVVTLDIVFLPGAFLNNLYARLDRGRYCRTAQGYAELVVKAGLSLLDSQIYRSHPRRGLMKFLLMALAPRSQ